MLTDGFDCTTNLLDHTALTGVLAAPIASPTWDDADEPRDPATQAPPSTATSPARGSNFYLDGDRHLARGWQTRALDNIAAITLSNELEQSGRAPTPDDQAKLIRFVGFGATTLAQNCFRRPGESDFRPGWENVGAALESAVTPEEYAALQRATQYAHYTPEPIIRALWRAAQRLGFSGGRVLEPGMGTGLFFALLPEALRSVCRLTGVEYDPVTARIARLLYPQARVRHEDYTRSRLGGDFDLAIGNPPFADRIVRADPSTRSLHLRLHDYFIARSIARLRPGALALFITSTGTMDKTNTAAREHIASMADLVGAVRLPEGSMNATAGTAVVIDVLVFQRRAEDQVLAGADWIGPRSGALRPSRRGRSGAHNDAGQPLFRGTPRDGAGRPRPPPRHLRPWRGLHMPIAVQRRSR
jgi:adenine-specific DNA methylase